jgi:hypothetical protein
MHLDPARVELLAVGVVLDLVGSLQRGLGLERDRLAGAVGDLQRLQLAVAQVARVAWDVAVDEGVGLLRGRAGLAGPADVLDDPDVAVRVVLDPLVAAAPERARDVLDGRGVVGGRGIGRCARVLRREQQATRERIPRRAVDR